LKMLNDRKKPRFSQREVGFFMLNAESF
jgi:hypothetical protein